MMGSIFAFLLGLVWLAVIFGYGIAVMVAGYQGIEAGIGAGWAIAALGLLFVTGFSLPITIGAFFGAMNVWGWHWVFALLFAAPGLLLVIPGALAFIFALAKDLFDRRAPS